MRDADGFPEGCGPNALAALLAVVTAVGLWRAEQGASTPERAQRLADRRSMAIARIRERNARADGGAG